MDKLLLDHVFECLSATLVNMYNVYVLLFQLGIIDFTFILWKK